MTEPHAVVRIAHPRRSGWQVRLKRLLQGLATVWVTPRWLAYRTAAISLGRRAFLGSSESIARIPGLRGVFLRQAFYRLSLRRCGRDVYFGWQSTFSMSEAEVGERAYIGRSCGIGYAEIGDDVMLADGVQILSGGREHALRGDDEHSMREQTQTFQRVRIGRGAWIGAGAIVMADVGEHSIVGAGAVVTHPVPPRCVAVGVPAEVIKRNTTLSNE